MSFVSFLKSAGKVLANIAAAEAGIEPIFKAALPASAGGAVDKLDLIFKTVVATEGQFAAAFPGQQNGAQKLVAASSLIGPVLNSIDTVAGTHVADQAALIAAIQNITGGIADYLNARQGGNSQTASGAAIPAPAVAVAQSAPAKPA
jgi:hypothetical protein